MSSVPKVYVSYSWDSDSHKAWVRELASRLRGDGVDVTLDQWHTAPGDQLTMFMESAIRESDFVIILCTPGYRSKSDCRGGGVGYEGDIMTAEAFTYQNQRKFIPILCSGDWLSSSPTWLRGKRYIDLTGNPYFESKYDELLATLHNAVQSPPPIGPKPSFDKQDGVSILSKEAQILLAESSQDKSGKILRIYVPLLGFLISTNGKRLSPKDDARLNARWNAAFDELLGMGLISSRGSQKNTFGITDLGYRFADQIKTHAP